MPASTPDRRDDAASAEDASRQSVLFPNLARHQGDPDAPADGSDGALARDAAWERLGALLGTAEPADVVDRVATLVESFQDLDQGPVVPPGLVTISEVEGVIRKLHRRVSHLQDRNEALTEQLEEGASDDETRAAYSQLVRDHERLLEALSVAGTQEGLRRLERLQQRLEHFYLERETLVQAGFRDADDVIDQIVQIEAELEAVRAEKERLARAAEGDERPARRHDDGPRTLSFSSDSGSGPLLNRLGVWSVDEADALIRSVRQMAEQLADLRSERAAVAEEVGVEGADDLVELIRSMEAQLADLYEEREHDLHGAAEAEASAEEDAPAAAAAVRPSGDGAALPPEAGAVLRYLGIRSLEEAKELGDLVRGMHERLRLMHDKMSVLLDVGIEDPADALAMIESMEAQLVDLYGRREEAADADARAQTSVLDLLGIASREEAEALVQTVRQMADQLADLRSERDAVAEEVGVARADDLVELIRSMEAQLADLYAERERALRGDGADGGGDLADASPWNGQTRHIQTILGIETIDDAEAMAEAVRQMHEQLQHLHRQQRRLLEVGLDSPADAVAMIESMEHQLVELYRDREEEATRQGRATITLPDGDTYDQLEQLYAQRERLMDALGVSDPDDLIDMVNALASQLDALYAERAEADRAAAADTDADTDAPAPATGGMADAGNPATLRVPANADATATMLASMEEQLQALYQEKQQLMDLGFDDADDAARRLSELEGQVAVLTDERDALRARLRTAETRRPAARRDDDRRQGRDDDRRASSGPPSDTYAPGPASDDDGPRVAPPETLRRLDTMSDDELDTLPFGVVQTDDQGVVQYASPDGVRLPGFAASPDEARGRNFFFDLAPSANNSLFRGRFQRGVEAGEMDTGFLYTFVGPGRPPAVARVQLYRAPDARTTWILHRPL